MCHVNLDADLGEAFRMAGSSGYLYPLMKAMQK